MALMQFFGSTFNKLSFWAKQHAPEILVGVGLTAGAASTALACYASFKEKDLIEESKENYDSLIVMVEDPEELKKEKTKLYLKVVGETAKNYAPAFGLFVAGTSCILYGTGILNKRNATLSMGLAAATSALRDYRREVIERYGEDVDQQLRYGIKTIESKTKETTEDGKTKTVKKNIEVMEKDHISSSLEDYIRVFDESNPYWDNDMDINLFFVRSQQYIYNQKLIADGHVYMNDVLKSLGFPVSRVGHDVGWNYDPDNPTIDNFIDFGIRETNIPVEVSDGSIIYKKAIVLNFNVDGGITDKVKWPDKEAR